MPFEATMMVIDNSEYMRNGDYVPNRFGAQADAVNTVFQTKIDSNPENTVGIMTMAGKGPEVLVTHTKDVGQILGGIHTASSKIGGTISIPTAINIAQLALKHRENKTLRQRIIVFVASPLEGQAADEKVMVRLAKNLKKNNVAVDIVCFGDGIEEEGIQQDGVDGERKPVLRTFIENVNSGDNSHLVIVPPSTQLLSDALIISPILAEDRTASIPQELLPGGAGVGAGAGDASGTAGPSAQTNFEFGVDPNLDPELALALRMSMQEAQAREAAEAAASSSSAPAQNSTPTTATPAPVLVPVPATIAAPGVAAAAPATVPADPTEDEEERLLQQALAMSQQQDQEQDDEDVDMDDNEDDMGVDEEEDEDEAIQRAIAMSMQEHNDQPEEDENGKK